jgi:phage pi2 protein 07
MDAFGAKPFLQIRYTKIVYLGPKNKYCIFLHVEGFLNAPKHNQTSFWVQWSRMDRFGVKTFSQLRYSKLGHSCPRHKFCILLHAEDFLNGPKDNQTSFWGQWSPMDAFSAKPFPQLRYSKIVHFGPKHKICIFLHAEGCLNAPKDNQTSFRVQWSRMNAFGAKPFPELR